MLRCIYATLSNFAPEGIYVFQTVLVVFNTPQHQQVQTGHPIPSKISKEISFILTIMLFRLITTNFVFIAIKICHKLSGSIHFLSLYAQTLLVSTVHKPVYMYNFVKNFYSLQRQFVYDSCTGSQPLFFVRWISFYMYYNCERQKDCMNCNQIYVSVRDDILTKIYGFQIKYAVIYFFLCFISSKHLPFV